MVIHHQFLTQTLQRRSLILLRVKPKHPQQLPPPTWSVSMVNSLPQPLLSQTLTPFQPHWSPRNPSNFTCALRASALVISAAQNYFLLLVLSCLLRICPKNCLSDEDYHYIFNCNSFRIPVPSNQHDVAETHSIFCCFLWHLMAYKNTLQVTYIFSLLSDVCLYPDRM